MNHKAVYRALRMAGGTKRGWDGTPKTEPKDIDGFLLTLDRGRVEHEVSLDAKEISGLLRARFEDHQGKVDDRQQGKLSLPMDAFMDERFSNPSQTLSDVATVIRSLSSESGSETPETIFAALDHGRKMNVLEAMHFLEIDIPKSIEIENITETDLIHAPDDLLQQLSLNLDCEARFPFEEKTDVTETLFENLHDLNERADGLPAWTGPYSAENVSHSDSKEGPFEQASASHPLKRWLKLNDNLFLNSKAWPIYKTKCTVLNLSRRYLPWGVSPVTLSQTLLQYPNLQHLNVSVNALTEFPPQLDLTNLQHLDLSENRLTALDVNNFTNLQHLNVEKNFRHLKKLKVNNLTNLQHLNVRENNLTELQVNNLTNLKHLNVPGNKLTTLDVNGLTNLKHLNVGGNKLTTFQVNDLTNLQFLRVDGNQLTALDVNKLTNLQHLDVSRNQLTTLHVNGLTNLQHLKVNENRLGDGPTFQVNDLTNLQLLEVNRNELTELQVNTLTNLESLDVSGNQLTTLDVNGLTRLQSVDVRFNKLIDLQFDAIPCRTKCLLRPQTYSRPRYY